MKDPKLDIRNPKERRSSNSEGSTRHRHPAFRLRHPVSGIQHLLVCLLPSAFCLCAQAQYSLDWWTLDGGGGTSTGGVYSVSGTIGQPDAGTMSGTNATGQSFTLQGGFWGMIAVIQTDGAPRLFIELTNGWTKVSWPAPADGWVLTETNRLTGGGSFQWPQVSATQYQTNGGRIFILTVPQPAQNRYYRLRKP